MNIDISRRLESNLELFTINRKGRLIETITRANPYTVANVICKVLESQILAEEFIFKNFPKVDEASLAQFYNEHREEIAQQVDKAIFAFIGSILSTESG